MIVIIIVENQHQYNNLRDLTKVIKYQKEYKDHEQSRPLSDCLHCHLQTSILANAAYLDSESWELAFVAILTIYKLQKK